MAHEHEKSFYKRKSDDRAKRISKGKHQPASKKKRSSLEALYHDVFQKSISNSKKGETKM